MAELYIIDDLDEEEVEQPRLQIIDDLVGEQPVLTPEVVTAPTQLLMPQAPMQIVDDITPTISSEEQARQSRIEQREVDKEILKTTKSIPAQLIIGAGRGIETATSELMLGFQNLTGHALNPNLWMRMLQGEGYGEAVAQERAYWEKRLGRKGGAVEEATKSIVEFLTYMYPAGALLNSAKVGAKTVGMVQKLAPNAPERAYRGIATLAETELAAIYAENAAFSAYEGRLSNLAVQVPALRYPMIDWLKADPNDPYAVAKLKQNLEATGVSIATAPLIGALGSIRGSIRAKAKTTEEVVEAVDKMLVPKPPDDPVRKVYENLELSHAYVPVKAEVRASDSTRIWLSTNRYVSDVIMKHGDQPNAKLFQTKVDLGDYLVVDGRTVSTGAAPGIDRGAGWDDILVGDAVIQASNTKKLDVFRQQLYTEVSADYGYTASDIKTLILDEAPDNALRDVFDPSVTGLDLDTVSEYIANEPGSAEFMKFWALELPSTHWNTDTIANAAEVAGFDSAIIKNIYEHLDDPQSFGDSIVVFDQNRLIDPVVPKEIRAIKPSGELATPYIRADVMLDEADFPGVPFEDGVTYPVGEIGGGKTPFKGLVLEVPGDTGEPQLQLWARGIQDVEYRQIAATYQQLDAATDYTGMSMSAAANRLLKSYTTFREQQYKLINQLKADAEKTLDDAVLGRPPAAKRLDERSWVVGEDTSDPRMITQADESFVLASKGIFPETQHDTVDLARATYRRQQDQLYALARAEYVTGPGEPAVRAAMDDKILELQWDVYEGAITPEQADGIFKGIIRQVDPDGKLYDDTLMAKLSDQV